MQTLPSKLDQTTPFQKVIAGILLAATLTGVVLFVNAIAPTILLFMKNIYYLIFLGTPLALGTLYLVTNPLVVWGFFKTLSWNFTKFLIKMDKLSVLDRYIDHLEGKIASVKKIATKITSIRISKERYFETLKQNIHKNLKEADHLLKKEPNSKRAGLLGGYVATDKDTLERLIPMLEKLKKQEVFLNELTENWTFSVEKLRYVVDQKRIEYTNLKEMAKALGHAEDFISGNTEAAKMYNESLRQIEESISDSSAKIEKFEMDSKPILEGIRNEREMLQNDGLAALEEYRLNGSLRLPDFSELLNKDRVPITLDAQAEEVTPKFKLLK